MKPASTRKHALVTGSTNGLGRALCETLLTQGWQVTGIDLAHTTIESDAFNAIQCDLSDRAAVDGLLAGDSLAGPFDLVVLNAAISATGRFQNIPFEAHEKLIRLNAETPMVMAAALAGSGRFATPAHLVFISSISHFIGYPGAASYAASKDAVAVYARSIRKPFARRGIRVSCVFPGPMRTDQARRHAPPDAPPDKRMPPQTAAELVLRDIFKGRNTIIPGGGPRAFAWFGRMTPFLSDRAMRRIIFEKLDRDVF